MNAPVMEMTPQQALAALAWQIELGADEAIGDVPVDRYAAVAEAPAPVPARQSDTARIETKAGDPVAEARAMAEAAQTLDDLAQAIADYPHCELRLGARNTVFSDGNPAARVMVIGEAPGRDEDMQGRPFVGRAGQLLDAMFAAIGMSRTAPDRESAVYITNVLPWRPPQNRDPKPEEIAMLMPFVARHVELADPEVIVAMGNIACQGLLGRRGITRLRGTWSQVYSRPLLPMFHPAYLLRQPHAKREAWADLLSLKARLREGG